MEGNLKWEMFCDDSYYHMFAVRPIDDERIMDAARLFHFSNKEDAEKFKELAEKATCSVYKKK